MEVLNVVLITFAVSISIFTLMYFVMKPTKFQKLVQIYIKKSKRDSNEKYMHLLVNQEKQRNEIKNLYQDSYDKGLLPDFSEEQLNNMGVITNV